eukprot:6608371-Heterocapsa_arctica.AAC.1
MSSLCSPIVLPPSCIPALNVSAVKRGIGWIKRSCVSIPPLQGAMSLCGSGSSGPPSLTCQLGLLPFPPNVPCGTSLYSTDSKSTFTCTVISERNYNTCLSASAP